MIRFQAIETLRELIEDLGLIVPEGERELAALADLQALAEAAEAVTDALTTPHERDEGWEDVDTGEWVSMPGKAYRLMSRNSVENQALAAALARVKGEQQG